MVKHFIPIESNPDVFTEYSARLGAVNIPAIYSFCDVLGLEEELLAMVPQPVLAVLLLFPITEDTERLRAEEQAAIDAAQIPPTPDSIYFMKQTIGNACGTIALLHCLANLKDQVEVKSDAFLSQFLAATKEMDPAARGKYLEFPPEGALSIDSIHEAAAQQGDTEAPAADADVDLHFAAFVVKEGRLWELDGRKERPIDHGPSQPGEHLLKDFARVMKDNYVAKAKSISFSLVALAPSY